MKKNTLLKKNIQSLFGVGFLLAGLMFFFWKPSVVARHITELPLSQLYAGTSLGQAAIQPLPQTHGLDPEIVALGRQLFMDTRLSEDNVSCISCHNIHEAGADSRKVSIDISGGDDIMNTPTLFNVGFNASLTWIGQHISLEEQVDMVLANSRHMNGNWDNVLQRLALDPNYVKRFNQLYEKGLSRDTVKHAIAYFERSLITPDAAFDRYLRGDKDAITDDQKSGYELFRQFGCISCHQGMNIGGNVSARLGTFLNPFEGSAFDSRQRAYNLGRYSFTGKDEDKRVFRVPSLRNVAKTPPYFHTGMISDLEQAVKFMAKYQVGRAISDEDARLIAEFLRSLSGRYEGRQI